LIAHIAVGGEERGILLLGMESTASYHIALFSYLTAQGYRVAIINPLLIANFAKLSLRKTKTDKKDAFTIAQFLLLQKETLAMGSPHLTELRDLSRRRERLADQMTSLKNDMKDPLVTFPNWRPSQASLRSLLRLLAEFPSARAIATLVMMPLLSPSPARRRKPSASVQAHGCRSCIGGCCESGKGADSQTGSFLLLSLHEQAEEIMNLIEDLSGEKIQRGAEILTSMRGIGDTTSLNFLIELGGDIKAFENDRKLIAAAGSILPRTNQGKVQGEEQISKRGNRHLRRVIWLMTTKVIISNGLRTHYFKRRKEAHIQDGRPGHGAQADQVMFSMLVNQRSFEPERRK
jgi:transposase